MKQLFVAIGLVSVTSLCSAQMPLTRADSLSAALKAHPGEDTIRVGLLIDLIKTIIYNAPDDAMKYSNEILQISQKIKSGSGIAFGYRYKGLVYYLNGDYVNALDYLQRSLQAADTLHNKKFEGSMYNNLAIVYVELKEYAKALSYYQKYLATSRELGLKEEEAKA